MKSGTQKKVDNLYAIMERLAAGEELYPQKESLQEALEVDERTLRRYLEEVHGKYGHIVVTEKKRLHREGRSLTVYRIVDKERDVSKIFRFFLENSDDLGWLLQLVHENDPTLLRDNESRESLQDVLRRQKETFLFIDTPFEQFSDKGRKEVFKRLKVAVQNREYRTIYYKKEKVERLEEVKCLKLVHMRNNWYIAVETKENLFRFLRLSFIEKVDYARGKACYQHKVIDRYRALFQKIQNPMTLDKPFETATLRASAKVAIYFKEDMKPFFPTQEFVRENDDGSVDFTVGYTQPMEILPFIKQWLPDITILSPETLKVCYLEELKAALGEYKP